MVSDSNWTFLTLREGEYNIEHRHMFRSKYSKIGVRYLTVYKRIHLARFEGKGRKMVFGDAFCSD